MKFLMNKIKSLIRTAVAESIKEDKGFQKAVLSSLGVKQEAVVFSPYGLFSVPDDKSLAVVLQCGSREDNLVSLVWNPKERPKLEKGEVALWHKDRKTGVFLKKDGSVSIEGKTKIEIKPDGAIMIDGVDWKGHKHLAGELIAGTYPVEGTSGGVVSIP